VERAYREVLRRPPQPDELEQAGARLRRGTLSRAALLGDLVGSPEFARVRLLDDAVAAALSDRLERRRPRDLTAPAGHDERPVEIRWTLARYAGERDVLDIGYAFAEPAYLAGLLGLGAERLVGVDLAEAEVPRLEGVRADVRELPFGDASFDVVLCVSTLEHVGADNAVYGVEAQRDESGAAAALRELRRILRSDGKLLVTVPAGEEERHGWQVQHDPREWVRIFESAGFLVFEDEIYELGDGGWQSARGFSASGVRYGARGPGASAVLCAELHPRRLSESLRLAIADRRRRGEPRRAT
jgi:SAM-dependent methyltransferase